MFYRAGELAECGAALMRGHRPDVTATVLARLDAAGAIDVGRLNMVEFALGITGHNAHTGHPRNPWDTEPDHRRLDQRRCGCRGGRLAAPQRWAPTPAARSAIPAACCGLVGLKPTYGRVSRFGCMPLSFSLDHVGPLARSARGCGAAACRRSPVATPRTRPRRRDRCRTIAASLRRGVARPAPGGADGRHRPPSSTRRSRPPFERAVAHLAEAGMRVTRVGAAALRPAQCPAPARDAGRDRGAASRAGRGRTRAATTRRPCPGWSRASPSPGSTMSGRWPRGRRCCAASAPRCSPMPMSWRCRPARWRHRASPRPTPAAIPASWRSPTDWARWWVRSTISGLPALSVPMGLDRSRHAHGAAARRQALRRGAAAARGARLRGSRRPDSRLPALRSEPRRWRSRPRPGGIARRSCAASSWRWPRCCCSA